MQEVVVTDTEYVGDCGTVHLAGNLRLTRQTVTDGRQYTDYG